MMEGKKTSTHASIHVSCIRVAHILDTDILHAVTDAHEHKTFFSSCKFVEFYRFTKCSCSLFAYSQ